MARVVRPGISGELQNATCELACVLAINGLQKLLSIAS
jgi:hypothetical protein